MEVTGKGNSNQGSVSVSGRKATELGPQHLGDSLTLSWLSSGSVLPKQEAGVQSLIKELDPTWRS